MILETGDWDDENMGSPVMGLLAAHSHTRYPELSGHTMTVPILLSLRMVQQLFGEVVQSRRRPLLGPSLG